VKHIAERMSQNDDGSLRIARISADHFAVVVAARSPRTKSRAALSGGYKGFGPRFRIGDTELRINAKAGIALFPNDGSDPIRSSGTRNLRSRGRNRRATLFVLYRADDRARRGEAGAREQAAAGAGERRVHPALPAKVDLERRSIVGVEALDPLAKPELGLVPPLQFIPLLEETD